MILFELFAGFFQVGLFSVGGGYAAMPLIEEQAVRLHGWLDMAQFADIMAIAEMTPGPIAVNAATFVGIQAAGIPGALAATAGCICPSCVIVLMLAAVYERSRGGMLAQILAGMRPAVIAMIASAGLSLMQVSFGGRQGIDMIAVLIFGASLVLLRWQKKSPIAVMAGAGGAGLLLYQML